MGKCAGRRIIAKHLLIFGYLRKEEVKREIAPLRPLLERYAHVTEIDLAKRHAEIKTGADMALVLGGDGTILRAAQHMGYQQVPTLGINLGKLGFLADLNRDEAPTVLTDLFENGFRITEHMMFECQVENAAGPKTMLGLNELVVHADPPLHMIEIDLGVDDENVVTFSGDGLILSTPIGSTGHNLSAGGPILRQELAAFVITPICAHALTYRPLVDSGERIFTISLRPESHPAILSVDGQQQVPLKPGQKVTLRQAAVKFKRIRVPGRSYYTTLREKLQWGAPPRYRTGPGNGG